ncbi:MAG: disulfide oxidoreductase [Rhodospirillales bacterium]|nr:disulfide oxidoreductase [Rhodospirillales bacterium]
MVRNDAPSASGSRIVAVLGPTNTGKTHLAMERMLGHASGMIGFPLRLLARENYDRAVAVKGASRVALITGEEKIVPRDASWFLCTVESMPVDRRVAFLAIDEIQMCADPDRGHLFTDRLLHARGELETMFMGAETVRPLLRRLVPEAEYISRPRFSRLTYAGSVKLTRLPPRSAIVAFSAADVYSIAELVRRQRGGAAIVLGALSPRTRNAQVAMYQAGEVDYLVATDAIGMGLNMQVEHVAFAATRKFDGRAPRPLAPAEMAQIAGRAGRYTKDGSFGTTAEIGPLDSDLAERIETHRFDALKALQWRNTELQFASIAALRTSLARLPLRSGLVRAREADDEIALGHLAADAEIAALARGREAVGLLWDVCCIPDFGKVTGEGHARLLAQMYRFLAGTETGSAGTLPTDWVARQVDRINRTDGDIEALMQRIANIRTWTYIAHRGSWLADASGWQERTRAIEDKLSDALHQRLIQRFVDRRTASLVGRMQHRGALAAAVSGEGDVRVEGHFVGKLDGFRFTIDPSVTRSGTREAGRAITTAAMRALSTPIRRRLEQLETDDDDAFCLADDGGILWHGALVGRLSRGADSLAPGIEPFGGDLLEGNARLRLCARLVRFVHARLRQTLAPLFPSDHDGEMSGAARGLLFQVAEALGALPRAQLTIPPAALAASDRKALAARGLHFGHDWLYFASLLKARPMATRALLWRIHAGASVPAAPARLGKVSLAAPAGVPAAYWSATGYRRFGARAVRIDAVERLSAHARRRARDGRTVILADFARPLGCSAADLPEILRAIGYRMTTAEDGTRLVAVTRPRRASHHRAAADGAQRPSGHSPFAALETLRSAR